VKDCFLLEYAMHSPLSSIAGNGRLGRRRGFDLSIKVLQPLEQKPSSLSWYSTVGSNLKKAAVRLVGKLGVPFLVNASQCALVDIRLVCRSSKDTFIGWSSTRAVSTTWSLDRKLTNPIRIVLLGFHAFGRNSNKAGARQKWRISRSG
jgi:hypothetical protein